MFEKFRFPRHLCMVNVCIFVHDYTLIGSMYANKSSFLFKLKKHITFHHKKLKKVISKKADFFLKFPRMVSKITNSVEVKLPYLRTSGDFVGTVQFLQSWLYSLGLQS